MCVLILYIDLCYNNSMQDDVIVSISTPLGKGAIAVVRLSGQNCLDVALKIFHSKNLFQNNIKARYMYYGKLEIETNLFEQCLMVYFKSPFSYTGEDVVEFQVHGGVLLAQKVLQKCLKAGARLAEAGEFSKRAFLNGKITLDKAEAIIGEINAEAEGELKSSLQLTNGKLTEQVLEEQETLKLLLAEIEVGMDYPDEAEETEIKTNIYEKLNEIKKQNEKILNDSKNFKFLRDGIYVALVGKTNVGKSSVMNALLGVDRAIVTDIKGTTRDQITESYEFKGVKINLIDTAGIRETNDVVESIGIEKSIQSLKRADIVLFVLDGSEKETLEDMEISQMLEEKKFIFVINKTDKKRVVGSKENEIEISALKNHNIENLKQKILNMVIEEELDFNALVFSNERQEQNLKEDQNILEAVINSEKTTLDVLSMQLKQLWKCLGKITGNTENEDIINLIFSKFCLGK